MAKIITFSRYFPAYHPKVGQPTYFVEKFYRSLGNKADSVSIAELNVNISLNDCFEFGNSIVPAKAQFEPKYHTIRAGHRFKAGDYFSPCVWSGKPYRSKQIVIAPDTEVKKVWDFYLYTNEYGIITININKNAIAIIGENIIGVKKLSLLAKNDGLEWDDMLHWFKIHPKKKDDRFDGQIICWNENVNY